MRRAGPECWEEKQQTKMRKEKGKREKSKEREEREENHGRQDRPDPLSSLPELGFHFLHLGPSRMTDDASRVCARKPYDNQYPIAPFLLVRTDATFYPFSSSTIMT